MKVSLYKLYFLLFFIFLRLNQKKFTLPLFYFLNFFFKFDKIVDEVFIRTKVVPILNFKFFI